MAKDREHYPHQEWLGYVQPVGLVVSPPALLAAQAHVTRNIGREHQEFLACLTEEEPLAIRDLAQFTQRVLGWETGDLLDVAANEQDRLALEVQLPEYGETLAPTHAVKQFVPKSALADAPPQWVLLLQALPKGQDFDAIPDIDERRWQATPQAKFERLLRETRVPAGLLYNHTAFRLVYAPRGETSGYMTFRVKELAETAGRPIFAALHMLLSAERLFTLPEKQRLPAILEASRKYQNVVSTRLAGQVLQALFELVRGFQAADSQAHGKLLEKVLAENPNHVYHGLLTVLMRLVFILYAEDRNLLSSDPVFANYYSLTGLFDRLRQDAGRFHDTMDQRFGAWPQLLTLFRLIYDGGSHGALRIPPRHGYLFDPERYRFLEGRGQRAEGGESKKAGPELSSHSSFDIQNSSIPSLPHVSDGVIYRVLNNLLMLDGERLSYRALDVEQIGSVYEAIMGFSLEVATGKSIAIKAKKSHGAPATINLEELLAVKSADRVKWLKEHSDQELTGKPLEELKGAKTTDDLLAALEKKIAREVTPNLVPQGAMVLQPSDERRRSGSHYTPRSLTEPIVRKTLEPILKLSSRFKVQSSKLEEVSGRSSTLNLEPGTLNSSSLTPTDILSLKICDPAMGSGAFLVEACRQLGDELVKAWHVHGEVPKLPPDEDEVLHARRLVAQRCLYGVDKNPMAVDLAKLSLWLATLAKDHPFTFLDHAFRSGDSLVGLTREQIAAFHWAPKQQKDFERDLIEKRVKRAIQDRLEILSAPDDAPHDLQQAKLALADEALDQVRLIGNLVISAFFSADKEKARNQRCDELSALYNAWRSGGPSEMLQSLTSAARSLRTGSYPIAPFHWEIEFPEVFWRENGGFDAIVGNPPYLGGLRISELLGMAYFGYLVNAYPPAGHMCDMAAYFMRRMHQLLLKDGTLGCITTKTIAQGDTRQGGLEAIRRSGGEIYFAIRRFVWPGVASVIATILCITKSGSNKHLRKTLDGREVDQITAYLFHAGGDGAPERLAENPYFSAGCNIAGMGFVFDDSDDAALPVTTMRQILASDNRYSQRILPYLGGAELNATPLQSASRYAYNLSDIKDEGDLQEWPALAELARTYVKPVREKLGNNPNNTPLKRRWWAYQAHRPELYERLSVMRRVLAIARVSQTCAFSFLDPRQVFSEKVVLFALESDASFTVLQSRVHESWARFLNATLKDDMQYAASDCFQTYPFPKDFETDSKLEAVGKEYYEFRAALMVKNDEGLTKTYNRFHDPDERSPDILQLRQLHADMDRAVLLAYGWQDLAERATCEFLLDYEEEEDEEPSP